MVFLRYASLFSFQILSMDANVSVADLMNFAIDPNARCVA